METREIELKIEIYNKYSEYERTDIFALTEYCRRMYSFKTDYEYLEKALELFNQGDYMYYDGVYSYTELAEMFVDGGLFGDIPEHLERYIDFEAIANDLKFDYEKLTTGIIRVD